MPPKRKERAASVILGMLACAVLFGIYAVFRQRYIWGSDSFGYYQLGLLFSQGRVTLPTEFSAVEFPALVPMGFSLNAQRWVVPNYTPGLPLMLAVGHLLRAPMLVTPFLGVLSCVLVFLLLRERVSRGVAAAVALAWAFMPLTVYGSTMLMSDGVAATVLLAAFLAWRRGWLAGCGWLLGLAIAVRPTNFLFLLPFLLVLRWDRSVFRLGIHLALAGLAYGFYNWQLFGAPWRTGYGNFTDALRADIFGSHFRFYVLETARIVSPLVVVLAGVALLKPTREKVFMAAWPLLLALFYSFWEGGGIDRWWWARFLQPGMPFVFLLAGEGMEQLRGWLRGRLRPEPARWAVAALWLAVLVLPVLYVRFGRERRDLWLRNTGQVNYDVIDRVVALAPPGSLIGSIEMGSTAMVYTRLVPFIPVDAGAPDLVAAGLARGRRVFLLVEPWNDNHPVVRTLLERFNGREIARYLTIWQGLPLYELTAPAPGTNAKPQ